MGKEYFTQQFNSANLNLQLKLNKDYYTVKSIDEFNEDYNSAINKYKNLITAP